MDLTTARELWTPMPGWLNTASYGLPPRPGWDAMQSALDDWRVGRTSWEGWDDSTGRARSAFARLVGVDPADVAVGSQISAMLAPVAAAIPGRSRVVVPAGDFTSLIFPFEVHAGRGVEVVEVPPESLADAAATADVVAFSLVQSATGLVADYPGVVGAARAAGAMVVVDATQACGWLPFEAGLADVVLASAYKWLMSPRGSAFAYLSPAVRERLTPLEAGWYAGADVHGSYYGLPMVLADDARRFDVSPAWFCWVATAPTLELVEAIGLKAICEHNVALANRFLAGLGRAPSNSAIATVDVPGAKEKLDRAGVRASVRGGSVRVAFHVYTTEADVDLALEALCS
jgi:selenocysteine lyase/cysteine desulfurase